MVEPSSMIHLTESALRRLKTLLLEHPDESLVRVAIVREGETSLTHRITLEDEPAEEDHIQEQDGLRVVMDPATAARMRGVTLDFSAEGEKQGFIFLHPDAPPDETDHPELN